MPGQYSLRRMVEKQTLKVLERGRRFGSFDQIRQRHFWSKYLFAPGAGNAIPAAAYDVFTLRPGLTGQGYPVPLTLLETNWRNVGRVPDNQNFVIKEVGVSVTRPQSVDPDGIGNQPANAPQNGIWANLPPATQLLINGRRPIHPDDAANLLYGTVLEIGFLTNNVPLGLCADFSQSGGTRCLDEGLEVSGLDTDDGPFTGDPVNGVPAAAFRRKLEVPILLQHGETINMRLNIHRDIPTVDLAGGGTGWFELRVDWWATESFVEKS